MTTDYPPEIEAIRARATALRDWMASHPDATEAEKVEQTKILGFATQRSFDARIRKVIDARRAR